MPVEMVDVTEDVKRIIVRGPFKGWVPDAPRDLLPADAILDCENISIHDGRISKLPGWEKWNTALVTGRIQNLARFMKENSTEQYVALTCSGLYKSSGASGFARVSTALNGAANNPIDWTIIGNKLIIANGLDAIQSWPGGASALAALAGSPPIGRMVSHFDNRLWIGWTTESSIDYPYRLKASAAGNAASWASVLTFDLVSGSEPPEFSGITALAPIYGYLAAYKQNAIWRISRLSASPFYQSLPIVEGIGCIGQNAVCAIPEGHVFVGREDVYQWSGAGAPEPISVDVHNELQGQIQQANWRQVWCTWDRNLDVIMVGIPTTSTTVDTIYLYNRRSKAWTVETGTSFTAFGNMGQTVQYTWNTVNTNLTWDDVDNTWDTFGESNRNIIAAGDASGQVFRLNIGQTRAATDYTGRVQFPYLDLGRPDLVKRVTRFQLLNLRTGTHSVQVRVGVADNPWQIPAWGPVHQFAMAGGAPGPFLSVNRRGRYIVPEVYTTVKNAPFSFSGFALDFVYLGPF